MLYRAPLGSRSVCAAFSWSRQMVDVCRDRDAYSCTLLMTAVQSGAIEVMKVVSGLMATYLTSDQVGRILLCPAVLSIRAFSDCRGAQISRIVALLEHTFA